MSKTELVFLFVLITICLFVLVTMLFALVCIASDLDSIKKVVEKEQQDESNDDNR